MQQEFNSASTEQGIELLRAAMRGDAGKVKNLVDAGVPVNVRNVWNHTPLMFAARSGNRDLAKLLIDAGADVNALGNGDVSVLANTAGLPDGRMADLLLAHGALPLAGNPDERVKLLRAATVWGHEKLFTALVGAGTDFHAADKDGDTLLTLAASANQPGILNLLIAAGFNLTQEKGGGRSATDRAADAGSEACLRVLLDHGVSPHGGEYGGSLLYRASKKGAEKAVALLLERGAKPNRRDDDSSAPLRVAIKGGHASCVDLLLKAGADPMNEAWEGSVEKTDEALAKEQGGEVEKLVCAAARKFHLPLAATAGDTAFMKTLLDEGIPVDTEDRHGMTALLNAVNARKTDAVKLLIERQANANFTSKGGVTPLYGAIMKVGEYSHKPEADPELMELLIAHGADVNSAYGRNEEKKPLLLIAVEGKQANAVGVLIKHKADLEIRGEEERPLLFIAVMNKDLATVNKLLEAGAGANVKDGNGRTPLFAAVANKDLATVNRLIEAGAHANITGKDGVTLRAAAEEAGNDDIISAIRQQYECDIEQIAKDATQLGNKVGVVKPLRFKPGA